MMILHSKWERYILTALAAGVLAAAMVDDGPGAVTKFTLASDGKRTSDKGVFTSLPGEFENAPAANIARGEQTVPGKGFTVEVESRSKVYIFVEQCGTPTVPDEWFETDKKAQWNDGGTEHTDIIYSVDASAGDFNVPAHNGTNAQGAYGAPHMVVIKSLSGGGGGE